MDAGFCIVLGTVPILGYFLAGPGLGSGGGCGQGAGVSRSLFTGSVVQLVPEPAAEHHTLASGGGCGQGAGVSWSHVVSLHGPILLACQDQPHVDPSEAVDKELGTSSGVAIVVPVCTLVACARISMPMLLRLLGTQHD